MKTVIKFQTTDGREFETIKQANDHVTEQLHAAIYTVVCNAAQRGDCRGFIGNHAQQFTESIIRDIPFLREKIAFFDDNQTVNDGEGD